MTLDERLCLARAGYSAQDIAQFEQSGNFAKNASEQPANPAQEPEVKPEQPANPAQDAEPAPAWAVALEQSIKALTAAQQARNVKFDDMGEPDSVEQAALNALDNVYNGGNK